MSSVLVVGMACVDVVHVASHFPLEDTDQRMLDRFVARGGNASNMCSVLAALKLRPHLMATMARDTWETEFITRDLAKSSVNFDQCVLIKEKSSPSSCIIVNKQNGSRTILHSNPDLPELLLSDFVKIDLNQYKWAHFEGRNVEQTIEMIDYCRKTKSDLIISAEIEKVGRNAEQLVEKVDLAFVSKEVSRSHGAQNKMAALEIFRNEVMKSNGCLVVPWGDKGAAAFSAKSNETFECDAFVPKNGVVNTIGAGDTFNAALIAALMTNNDTTNCFEGINKALETACRVAGARVGQQNLDENVAKVFDEACNNK